MSLRTTPKTPQCSLRFTVVRLIAKMNSSSHSISCDYHLKGFNFPEWRPNFLTTEMSAALISVTIINLLVSPLTIFLNVLVILAVKSTPQLRNKYNALLACLARTDIINGALGQPLFIAEQIYRLTGSHASEFCAIPYAARRFIRTSLMSSLLHLTLISIERYISIKFTFKYQDIVTKRRLISSVILAWSMLAFPMIFLSFNTNDFLRSILLMLTTIPSIFILIFCRMATYYEARNQMRKIKTQQISAAAAATFLKERKAFKTTTFVIAVVLLCYLPNVLFRVVFVLRISSPETLLAIEGFILTLVFCNSVFNPVVYCARSREYRRAFKKLLRRANYVQPV